MRALSWPNVGTATEKKKPNAPKGTDLAPWKYVNSSDYRTQYVPRVPAVPRVNIFSLLYGNGYGNLDCT